MTGQGRRGGKAKPRPARSSGESPLPPAEPLDGRSTHPSEPAQDGLVALLNSRVGVANAGGASILRL